MYRVLCMLSIRIAFPMLKISMKIVLCNHSLKFPFRPIVVPVGCELRGIYFCGKMHSTFFFFLLVKEITELQLFV